MGISFRDTQIARLLNSSYLQACNLMVRDDMLLNKLYFVCLRTVRIGNSVTQHNKCHYC